MAGGVATARTRRRRVVVAVVLLLCIVAGVWVARAVGDAGAPPNYAARDAALRAAPLRFYRADHARAFVWFLGNDVGFWGAQQRLAASLATHDMDVVGFDLRAWLATRPNESPDVRADAFRGAMQDLIARSRRELGDTALPLVLAGHSVGAEVALWLAAADTIPWRGVVAISPGSRGHLKVTASDLAFGEPTEPGSFAVDSVVHAIASAIRVAVVRGASDRLRGVDASLVRARPELRLEVVPLAGHSMRRLFIAGPMIENAMGWAAGW
jgi:pimeloyl-ACP methyl ester carboxylesterase